MKNADEATTPLEGITVVTEPAAELLNERQQIDYRNQREQCLEWLLVFGKDPKKADGYTTNVTHDHADAYLLWLAKQEHSNAHKDNCRKALQMLYKWREHEQGLDEWEPELSFSTGHKTTAPRDYLTREERGLIREAALEHGSVPAYKGLDAEERDRWKAYLAQRLEKPKSAVTPDDWGEVNDEYIVFENTDDTSIELAGWTVQDESGATYTFPEGAVVEPDETVTLRTGSGDDTATEYYWKSTRPIWNNAGDTVIVTNTDGEQVLTESYS